MKTKKKEVEAVIIRFPVAMLRQIDRTAAALGESRNMVVRVAVRVWLARGKWLKSERRRICAPTPASSKAQKLRGLSPKYIVVDEMSPRFRQSKAAAARARSKNGRFKAHKPRSRRKA
jgi:Arc/MetJ-type ribon-helix-helix transcriptional regulator